MFPTAAAACAARGDGGSPDGTTFAHLPDRTSKMWTSLVAPARRMPVVCGVVCGVCDESGEGRVRGEMAAQPMRRSIPVPLAPGGPGEAGGPPSVRDVLSSAVAPPRFG